MSLCAEVRLLNREEIAWVKVWIVIELFITKKSHLAKILFTQAMSSSQPKCPWSNSRDCSVSHLLKLQQTLLNLVVSLIATRTKGRRMRGILFLSESSLKSSRTTSATIHYSNKPFVVKCHSVRLSTRLTYRQWCQQDQSQISRSLASTYYRRKRVIASQRIRTSPSQFKLLAKARQTAYQSTAACSERYGKYFVSKVCV